MKPSDKPIVLSGREVRACLREVDPKTMTRRVVKPQPPAWIDSYVRSASEEHWIPQGVFIKDTMGFFNKGTPCEMRSNGSPVRCPYGSPGARLWVRETWAEISGDWGSEVVYAADYGDGSDKAAGVRYRPSIHMPRWASRITLELTDVRVERLQEITAKDVVAEGFPFSSDLDVFKATWDKLNARRGFGWSADPWVWALSFRRLETDQ